MCPSLLLLFPFSLSDEDLSRAPSSSSFDLPLSFYGEDDGVIIPSFSLSLLDKISSTSTSASFPSGSFLSFFLLPATASSLPSTDSISSSLSLREDLGEGLQLNPPASFSFSSSTSSSSFLPSVSASPFDGKRIFQAGIEKEEEVRKKEELMRLKIAPQDKNDRRHANKKKKKTEKTTERLLSFLSLLDFGGGKESDENQEDKLVSPSSSSSQRKKESLPTGTIVVLVFMILGWCLSLWCNWTIWFTRRIYASSRQNLLFTSFYSSSSSSSSSSFKKLDWNGSNQLSPHLA